MTSTSAQPSPPEHDTPAPDISGDAEAPSAPRLSLTDFLDTASLQEIQDAFTSVTRLITVIRDADGKPVAAPTDAHQRAQSDIAIDQLISADVDADGKLVAPITVEGQELGSIEISQQIDTITRISEHDLVRLRKRAEKFGLSEGQLEELLGAADDLLAARRGAAIQFLYLMANSIARLCYDAYHARQRVQELSALYQVSNLISAHRDMQQVLDTAVRAVSAVMQVRGVVIRLLEEGPDGPWLKRRASIGLSEHYEAKGRLLVNRSEMFQHALAGELIYIEDMTTDPRVYYPDQAREEGLASMLCVGMNYRGLPIGTVQLFTSETRRFTHFEQSLLRAIAQLLASAIENAKLDSERHKNQQMIRQLHLAADVQRRMMPQRMPQVPRLDIAARYVPSYELGGDFYDFITLESSLGVTIGDVVGKGVAASLLMASVRSALRAYAQDVYDLDEVISRVNIALCSDTRDSEFATLWYGVIDPTTLRLTYCSAGHEPTLLVRKGKVHQLDTGGMIVGVDPQQHYDKGIWDLQTGDVLLLYTDGLPDAFDREGNSFGRHTIENLLLDITAPGNTLPPGTTPGNIPGVVASASHEPNTEPSAADILNHILHHMRKHTGLRRSTDDCTLVVIKVKPSP